MAQQIKDLELSLLWLGSLLWHWFNPWPWNFCMPQAQPKKKKPHKIFFVGHLWCLAQSKNTFHIVALNLGDVKNDTDIYQEIRKYTLNAYWKVHGIVQ